MIRNRLKIGSVSAAVAAVAITCWAAVAPVRDDWKISGPFGGTATTVAIDPGNPGVLLAGGLNTLLFKTKDYGASWTLLDFPQQQLGEVTSILIDPIDPLHYLVGILDAFGGGLMESRDSGATWSAVADLKDIAVRALAVSPSNPAEFVAGTVRGVMLSTDSGKTWSRISDPTNLEMQGITSLAIDPKDANSIYAGTSHLPWKTTDAGKNWRLIHDGMIDDSDVFSIYVDPAQPNAVYASACSGIYASQDRGELWRKIAGIPNTSRRTHVVRVDPAQAKVIYAGTTTGLFRSPDGGTTWKTLTNTQVNSMAFDPAQAKTMYLALLYEGLGKSLDGAQTIQQINEGFVDRNITSVASSGTKLMAIEAQEGESTGIFSSTDRGETWSQIRNSRGLTGVHLRWLAAGLSDDHNVVAATARELFRSSDGGATWKPLPLRVVFQPVAQPVKTVQPRPRGRTAKSTVTPKPRPIIRTLMPSDVAGLWSISKAGKDIYYAATNLGLFESTNSGEQWTTVELPGAVLVNGLYAAASDGAIVLRTSSGLFISNDRGAKWEALTFPLPIADVNDIAIPVNSHDPLLVATRVGIYSSKDCGSTWTKNPGGLPSSTISAVVYCGTRDVAYAAAYGRLLQSQDGAESWSAIPSDLQRLEIKKLWAPAIASGRVYAITAGLGILFRD